MDFLSHLSDYLVLGLTQGSLYALIAVGYTLVYGVLQLINFAHSEVFMAGAFGGLFLVLGLVGPRIPHGAASVGLILAALIVSGAVGGGTAFALERVAYRPLRKRHAPRLVFLISAIGASFFLYNFAGKLFGREPITIPVLYQDRVLFHVGGAPVRTQQLILVGAALVVMLALDVMVQATPLGRSIRAVAQDPETAGLMGIDVDKVIARTFMVGGSLAGVAGFLYAMSFNVQYNMGFLPGIKAFAAAVLGGIGNIRGAMLGGLLLGLVESMSVSVLNSEWKDVTAFVVLVLVLMFRPTGILGERVARSA